ncbi:MAG: DNA methyltransferase [Candidatus Taylorbacteria bacterium RIFOXYD2_FULL_36_9]|uniref:DNA methyltransferase n=1 Tax=Candidatus Taylorbacteria bacterium RIFOXYD2_FULL_36_9 TaxID=1802338 RepID=A0A1G2PFW5_9BACT|nr:MAG: DNA methyltransferase [Candidatus Taylorbacteria bacterium RIFOXYD2_FULL_36_9]
MTNKKQKLELTWIGKDEELKLEPRILIEDPSKSYGDKSAENMLIHGDNLLALKALEQDFAGKIKCIYIDPPFNTGAAFEHYDDSVEHSIWLQLMQYRLELLRKLLREDGCIFVQLDDSEASYCKVLMDEIFGRSNYLNQLTISTNSPFGFKATSSSLFKQANQLLLFAKDKQKFSFNKKKLFIEKEYDIAYKWFFENTDKPESLWTWRNISEVVSEKLGFESSKEAKKNISKQELEAEIAIFALSNADRVFRTASVTGGAYLKRKETINLSKTRKDKITRHPNDDMDYMFIGGERVIYYSERLVNLEGQNVPGELITDIWTDISIEGLASEGGVVFPKGKKPEKIIQRCFDISTKDGDYVLDSFLGSGTTAAVAQKMGLKWVGIEIGDHANTHCIPRLKSVIAGTDQSGISKSIGWTGGGGFKFYNLASSLLRKDSFGNFVIDENYNANMLAAAMCKHEGFKFYPDETLYWKHGKSTETDFIFVTTGFITAEQLDKVHSEMKAGESLLICAKAYAPECENHFANITIKKIPQMILGRCEFGKDNYDLNIIKATKAEAEESNEAK